MSVAPPSVDQLKELALPAPFSYAPQTWGWWTLLVLLVVAAVVIGVRRYLHWRRDRYRREGLERLAQLRRHVEDPRALRELPELLKRVAMAIPVAKGWPWKHAVTPPPNPAALGGAQWQAFLQRHFRHKLPGDLGQQLAQFAYAPDEVLTALPVAQREALFDTCQRWVEQHHVAA